MKRNTSFPTAVLGFVLLSLSSAHGQSLKREAAIPMVDIVIDLSGKPTEPEADSETEITLTEKTLTTHVTQSVMKLPVKEPTKLFCIHPDFKKQDVAIAMLWSQLQRKNPVALSTEDCFNLLRMNAESLETLAKVSARIETLSDSKISFTVPEATVQKTIESMNEQLSDQTLADATALPTHFTASTLAGETTNEEPAKRSFLKKALRGQLLVTGQHLLSLTALFLTPPSFTKWEYGFGKELLSHGGERIRQGWSTPPVMDKDNFWTNMVAHPYNGAYYYNVWREQGSPIWQSFLYSAIQSSLFWEYGLEAFFEQPSIQDLIFTPTLGSLMGEGAHQLTNIMKKNGFNTIEKVLVTVINPAYVLNHGYKTWPRVKKSLVD